MYISVVLDKRICTYIFPFQAIFFYDVLQLPSSTPSKGKKFESCLRQPTHVHFNLDPPEKICNQHMFTETELEVNGCFYYFIFIRYCD